VTGGTALACSLNPAGQAVVKPWSSRGKDRGELAARVHADFACLRELSEKTQSGSLGLRQPDTDGATRWRCPFCAGLLRARKFPKTMRRPVAVPLVPIDEGCEQCCAGIQTAMPAELPLWQRIPFGTTAWRLSMGRRQVVESVNAALKGTFADLSRGFFRVFGRTKMTILLGFTITGYNLDRIRSSRAKKSAQAEAKPAQPKRRRGTWNEVIDKAVGAEPIERPPDT
jgi:hypothetical protein